MRYIEGADYRSIKGFKKGKPVYEMTKIRRISGSAEGPQTLYCENGVTVELVGPWPKAP